MLNQRIQYISIKSNIEQVVLTSQNIDAKQLIAYFQNHEMLSKEESSLIERVQDKTKTLS